MTEDEWKVVNIRASVMAMMLNGTIDWSAGCSIRAMDNKDLLREFGK